LVPGAIVIYLWRPFRGGYPSENPAPSVGTGVALATFITANAASQTIVAAGPIVVGALGAGASERSVLFETFLLFRAPLTVAYSLIARVLPPFTRLAESGGRSTLARWSVRFGALAAVLATAAFAVGRWIGPSLVALFLGEEYRPSPGLAAYAAAGVVIATTALFVQQMLIALRATTSLAVAWLCGLLAATVTVTIASGDPSLRVGLGFLTGEVVALGLIVLAVVTAARKH
jgi:O-antigen/teichoic acid export membrane protein